MKMNVPNQLTMLRMLLIPAFIACFLYIESPLISALVACGVFILASITDFLDGMIARKFNLVTNFGKFMDSVADKALVFSAFLLICAKVEALDGIMIWTTAIVFIRELGVTSIRLVCASSAGKVIAANMFGKLKTVTQMTSIIVILIEYALIESGTFTLTAYIPSFVLIILMTIMTVASGISYLKTYLPYINSNN